MDHATTPNGRVVASAGAVAHAEDVDNPDLSVAGEEDPGPALDVTGPRSDEPEARWCPCPRQVAA